MRNDAHQYFLGTSNEEFEQEYWEGYCRNQLKLS